MAVLYENDAFQSKKRYSGFLKKIFVFGKIGFELKELETLKISTICHIKACRSLKQRALLKIASTVF